MSISHFPVNGQALSGALNDGKKHCFQFSEKSWMIMLLSHDSDGGADAASWKCVRAFG